MQAFIGCSSGCITNIDETGGIGGKEYLEFLKDYRYFPNNRLAQVVDRTLGSFRFGRPSTDILIAWGPFFKALIALKMIFIPYEEELPKI